MVAKVAGGIIGLGLIGTGGIAFVKPEWLGISKGAPEWNSLAKEITSSSGTEYSGKWGEKWKNYLVGVTNKEEKGKNINQDWWEWSFERLKKDTPSSNKFKYVSKNDINNAVKSPYAADASGEGAKALNQVCKAAYQAEKDKVTEAGDKNDEYKEEDLWKYCSGLAEKPKTVSENNETGKYTTTNAIGQNATESKKLVSTKGNNKFWEIRDKEFKNIDDYGKIETTTDNFFKHEGNSTTTIRDLCEKAYNIEPGNTDSTEAKPKKDKVLKYCSLSKE